MTQINVEHLKAQSDSSVDTMEWEKVLKPNLQSTSPKAACLTHGPSQTPALDRDLRSPHAREHIIALATALSELANADNCTKCTVEKVSALLTLQARDIKVANRNKGWTKEDKRVRKVEFKILCQGVKKDMKALWKGKR